MFKLAIIIPAFKKDYLAQTLESIASQTCQDFTLYIGDDHSPDNLYQIIRKYEPKLNLFYHCFDNNLGRINLVGQWERSIRLAGEEEWIWLFSDDDLMDSNCVQRFYEELSKNQKAFDLFRFNTQCVDENGYSLGNSTFHPLTETGLSFLNRKLDLKTNSYAIEYIFNKSIYEKYGGLVNFPLAWASDDATWALFGKEKGIFTIPGPIVKWRYSGINISSRQDSRIAKGKLKAVVQFIKWTKEIFGNQISDELLFRWSLHQLSLIENLRNFRKISFFLNLAFKTVIRKKSLILGFAGMANNFLRSKGFSL